MGSILHTPHTIYSLRHVPSWLLLSAAAGAVNGFAFLICEEFVTHVTGTVTRVGLEWQMVGLALEYVLIVAAFIVGAATSVMAIQARVQRGKQPRAATSLIFVALILCCVAGAGWGGVFDEHHVAVTEDQPPVVLLSILAFAMGLQNAAVATTTGLAVRTTHLTGPATDFGIHLGVVLLTKEARESALWGAGLRGGKMAAFAVGAILAVPLTGSYEHLALLAPATFVLMATLLSFTKDWTPSDLHTQVDQAAAPPADASKAVAANGKEEKSAASPTATA